MVTKIEERNRQIAEAVAAGETLVSVAKRFNIKKVHTVGRIARSLGSFPTVVFSLDDPDTRRMYREDRADNRTFWGRPNSPKQPRPYIEPLRLLNIGESTLIDCEGDLRAGGVIAWANSQLYPFRYVGREERDGIRVWRMF